MFTVSNLIVIIVFVGNKVIDYISSSRQLLGGYNILYYHEKLFRRTKITLQEILQLVEQNSDLPQDLEKASRSIPTLHGKFIGLKAIEDATLKALEFEYDVVYRDRWLFYSGKANPSQYKEENFDLRLLKSDIDIFLNSDKQLHEIKSKISVQKIKLSTIDEFIKSLNARQWNVKNVIDWLRYNQGMV